MKTKPVSGDKKIICNWCSKETRRWNNHHWTDGGKIRTCTKCHNEINYYLSQAEQKAYGSKEQVGIVKTLIEKRKMIFGEIKDNE